MSSEHTKILHSDTCPICAREVAAYDKLARKHGIRFDIDGLEQAGAWDLDEDSAARVFRVRKDGQLYEGVAAFRILWAQLPYWRHVAWLTGLPGLRQISELGYRFLAAPFLYHLHKRRQRASR